MVNGADVALMSSLAFLAMGDEQRGLDLSYQGTEQALSASGLECAMFGHYCTGLNNLHTRNLDEAQRAFASSLKLLADHPEIRSQDQLINEVHAGSAIAQFFGGRSEALSDMERTLKNAEAIGDEYTVAFIGQALGEAYTSMGDFGRAKRYLDIASEYYRRNDMVPYLARVLKSVGYWHEEQGQDAEAEQARAEYLRLLEGLPKPPVRPLSCFLTAPDESAPTLYADR